MIRGLSGPRVLVLTNGIGMIDASGLSPDHQVASDPQEAERIEVLRGPSALAYGGSAIGGVVNIIDERIPSTYEAGVHGRVLGEASSVDDGTSVSGAIKAGLGGHWMFTADGVHRRADPYDVPVDPISSRLAAIEGLPPPSKTKHTVPNTFSDLDAYGAGLSYVGDGGAWGGVSAKHTDSEYGSAAEEDVRIKLKQTRVDVRGGADVDLGIFDKVKFAAGYADYKHTEFEGGEVGTTFLSDGVEGRLELVQKEHDGWQGAVGVQGLHRNFDAIGEEALVPKTDINEAGIFTLQRLDKGGWGVEGGLRVDLPLAQERPRRPRLHQCLGLGRRVLPAGAGLVPGRVCLAHQPRAHRGGAVLARPAPGDRRLRGRRRDPRQGGLQLPRRHGALHHRATEPRRAWLLFALHQLRRPAPDRRGRSGSGLPIFRFVEGKARFYGGEFEGSYEAWRQDERSLKLEASADWVRGKIDGVNAPRIPPWSLAGRAIYDSSWWSGTVEVRHVAEQDKVANFEIPTDDYTMINASLTFRPLASNRTSRSSWTGGT